MPPEPTDEFTEEDLVALAREHGKPLEQLNKKVLEEIRRQRTQGRKNELSNLLDDLDQDSELENNSPEF